MITFADNTMLSGVAELRRVCFDEDEDYIRFYLTHRFTTDNTLVYVEQGRVVSSLTLLPVTMVTPVRNFEAAYVYAVATLPAYRRRGFAAALLENAAATLASRGVAALFLAPASEALVRYYAGFGYEPCFYRKKIVLKPDAFHAAECGSVDEKPLLAPVYARLRDAAYTSGGYFARWDEPALAYALQECEANGGLACSLKADTSEGFFVAYPEDNAVVLKESFLNPLLWPYVLQRLQQHFGHDKPVICYQPIHAPVGAWHAGRGDVEPFALLKCLTPTACPDAAAIPYFGLALD
jgi:ribosomal protein S18 acetylase RimI-like enzyme